MQDPLLWNPLPDAAAYLTHKTGRIIDARMLADIVARLGKQGEITPTIIKALVPRTLDFAVIAMPGHPEIDEYLNSFEHEYLTEDFGPLPGGMAYIGVSYPTVAPLAVNELVELVMYGEKHLRVLLGHEPKDKPEMVWIMPWGTSHKATLETCGITRDDLIALGEALTAPASGVRKEPAKTARAWQDEARAIADELDTRDAQLCTHDSLTNLADRVAAEMRERNIKGPRGPVTGSTIRREALQGGLWARPRDREKPGGAGETGGIDNQ